MSSRSDRWDQEYRPPLPPEPWLVGMRYNKNGDAVPANGAAAEWYEEVLAAPPLARAILLQKYNNIGAMASEAVRLINAINLAALQGQATRQSSRPANINPIPLLGLERRV